MLDCAHFDPGLANIVYSSACVGSTSYFVAYAEVASQGENRQGAGIREGADQRYFTVLILLSTQDPGQQNNQKLAQKCETEDTGTGTQSSRVARR